MRKMIVALSLMVAVMAIATTTNADTVSINFESYNTNPITNGQNG